MTRRLASAAIVALSLAAAPAFAQEGAMVDPGGDKVNQLIVYGDDPCPTSASGEITVCARKPEEERYRIPEPLRGIDKPQSEAWANKVQAYETVGRFGTLSCSPVGAGGSLGCTQQLVNRAFAERANSSEVRFSELIEEEREKRLSTIDAQAAAEQARVEEAEQAYFEQQQRQQAERDTAEGGTDAPLPPPGESPRK
ncbi:hypothetical protein AB3M93_06360 [Novosphingobium panipatense]|jgi:hypothetical protein|uniref:DUF4124 domain-containing protein n=2 Tax=Novosphingobium panipatense TaxID=428991 RepID=A0ABY1QF70_9SPHN|nr:MULTISPECIES: hypothetical protein [Novosphingobium]SMP67898.1 hypothetical protein SAMN06296065_104295 [Novosphingobium panipatense]